MMGARWRAITTGSAGTVVRCTEVLQEREQVGSRGRVLVTSARVRVFKIVFEGLVPFVIGTTEAQRRLDMITNHNSCSCNVIRVGPLHSWTRTREIKPILNSIGLFINERRKI
jgi:hypothetical protein